MAKKNGKIPVATIVGLALTAKQLFDEYKSASPDLKAPALIMKMTGYITPGLETRLGYPVGTSFDMKQPVGTWAPTIGGSLISKYVGGPKGLNVNASIRAMPMFKI